MTIPDSIPLALLDTVLSRLALLFLTGAAGDLTAAREAARHVLAGYNVATEEELHLAAQIISFSLHTLEALSYAANPDLSLNKVLRLRGGAVSLSREQHKAQRKLDQLQRERRAGIQPAAASPAPAKPSPRIDNAIKLIESVREAVQTSTGTKPQTWSQAFQKRQTAKRIAEKLKKYQARHAATVASAP